MRYSCFHGKLLVFACIFLSMVLCACGYSKEEKRRMKEIQETGRLNGVRYVEEKYGFTPDILDVQVCMEYSNGGGAMGRANGYVLAVMKHEDKTFRVHISGEEAEPEGRDDYEYETVRKEAKGYFQQVLGYEVYDILMEYEEIKDGEACVPSCHKYNLISEPYEAGSFENMLQRYFFTIQIADCMDQDLTAMEAAYPFAAGFFRKYSEGWGNKAVLISYRSREDYEKGCDHTYGSYGILDFGIENDGLYIRSYAVFDGEEAKAQRFELLEYDGIILSGPCWEGGSGLTVFKGEHEWLELGETDKKAAEQVYSVVREYPGDTTVYLPVQEKRSRTVWIQHEYDKKWWQYESNVKLTKDKEYLFFTFLGIGGSSFDFVVD